MDSSTESATEKATPMIALPKKLTWEEREDIELQKYKDAVARELARDAVERDRVETIKVDSAHTRELNERVQDLNERIFKLNERNSQANEKTASAFERIATALEAIAAK